MAYIYTHTHTHGISLPILTAKLFIVPDDSFGSSVPLMQWAGVFIGNVRFAMYAITFTETRDTPYSANRAPPNYFSVASFAWSIRFSDLT